MILRAIGIMPIGIGVMILVTIWTGGMGATPLVVKLFVSFIALGTIIKAFGFILSGSDFMPNLRRLSDRVRFMA